MAFDAITLNTMILNRKNILKRWYSHQNNVLFICHCQHCQLWWSWITNRFRNLSEFLLRITCNYVLSASRWCWFASSTIFAINSCSFRNSQIWPRNISPHYTWKNPSSERKQIHPLNPSEPYCCEPLKPLGTLLL